MLDDWFHVIVYEQLGLTILVPNMILLKTFWKVSLMHQSWSSCSRCDIFRRNALLISGSMRCFVTWLYFMCCTSWMWSVCGSWYIYIAQVAQLSFALLGWRTGLQRSSWYLFAKMMLASAPESTFMVYRCSLILMVTIVLGYSCPSFAKFLRDTLFGSFNWRSTDPQTFPKCTFCHKDYRWHCGICSDLRIILSPHNTYKFWSFSLFVYFLKSFPPQGRFLRLHSPDSDTLFNNVSVGLESIVFQEIYFLLQLQWLSCCDQLGKVHILLDNGWL